MSFLNFLLEKDVINRDLYELLYNKNDVSDSYICDFILSIGNLSEEDLAILKSQFFGLEYTNLDNFLKIDGLNYEHLKELNAIPFMISPDATHVAISDPSDLHSSDKINFYLSSCKQTKNLKTKYYVAKKSDIIYKFQEINTSETDILENIISHSLKYNSSDIHITPFEHTVEIMFRIDGALETFKTLNIDIFESLAIKIKVLSKLDITESRRPQSGHFEHNRIDFRISTHPTINGENIVIRILNKNKSFISIENLGFSKEQTNYLKQISNFSNGMIIFCGPTGSGKTTSIYSLLETIDKKSKNIMTLEDPIEYKIQNIKQTEIKKEIINFADGVRSILRQDPDVILIGEIRDEDTAKMAIRASMTGHLVLTTIHSNDSFGALTRFKEFGISESLIADNIIAIISQRLVKKINGGRTVVSEILKINHDINNMIYSNVSKHILLEYAINNTEFKTIYDTCLEKVQQGIISEHEMNNTLRIFVN